VTISSAAPSRIAVSPIGINTSAMLRSGLSSQWWIEVSTKARPMKPAPPPATSKAHIRRNWLKRSRATSVRGA